MSSEKNTEVLGKNLKADLHNYRAFVGPSNNYDVTSAVQFNLLTQIGLRENHFLLDIGCGSLRAGRLFIPYLQDGRYFGIEPEKWLIEEGIKNEIGKDLLDIKHPVFSNNNDYNLSIFNKKFDYILAQSIFSHAPETSIRKCLFEAEKVMKPTSIFAVTFFKGDKDYTGDKWVYPGSVNYTISKIKKMVEEANLICKPIEWPHPKLQTWILILKSENRDLEIEFSNFTKTTNMKKQLIFYKENLAQLENHPYVKLGKKFNRVFNFIRKK